MRSSIPSIGLRLRRFLCRIGSEGAYFYFKRALRDRFVRRRGEKPLERSVRSQEGVEDG